MNNSYPLLRIFLATLLFTPVQSVLADDDDYIEARHLLEAGEILPLEVILKNVRQKIPGKVLEVELEKEDKTIVYEVEILSNDGIIQQVYIDARTGKLLSVKEEN